MDCYGAGWAAERRNGKQDHMVTLQIEAENGNKLQFNFEMETRKGGRAGHFVLEKYCIPFPSYTSILATSPKFRDGQSSFLRPF